MDQHKQIINSHRFVFIKFSANFCKPCKSPLLLQKYESLKERYYEDVKFIEYIAENDEEVFDYERVSSVPTFKFYMDGEVKYEKVGLEGLAQITELVRNIIEF